MVSIEVKGLKDAEQFLRSKNKRAIRLVKQGVSDATLFLHGEVKLSIAGERAETKSVDTGRFLNSVDATIKPLEGKVSSDLEYAPKLEHGTSKFVGRKHFNNSANRNKEKVRELIERKIKQI